MREKKPINVEVGERIKLQREKAGLTQERFSEMLDISPNHISDIERGISGVSLETLRNMCRILCVSSDWILMGGGGEEKNGAMELAERLQRLDHTYFEKLSEIINLYIEAVTLSGRE